LVDQNYYMAAEGGWSMRRNAEKQLVCDIIPLTIYMLGSLSWLPVNSS